MNHNTLGCEQPDISLYHTGLNVKNESHPMRRTCAFIIIDSAITNLGWENVAIAICMLSTYTVCVHYSLLSEWNKAS